MQVAAGNLRQQLGDDDRWTEARIILRSINDVNLPKFTVEDLPLFEGITSDLFPGVELGGLNHVPLLEKLDAVCAQGVPISPGRFVKLIPKPSWKRKVSQLYEMVLVRHGVMIVGRPGSGKTTTVHSLANAMSLLHEDGFPTIPRVQVRLTNSEQAGTEILCVTTVSNIRRCIHLLNVTPGSHDQSEVCLQRPVVWNI